MNCALGSVSHERTLNALVTLHLICELDFVWSAFVFPFPLCISLEIAQILFSDQ